jgi:hypothetical protein
MDPCSQEAPKFASENNGLTHHKLPVESPDDFFKQRGIEPSLIKIDAEYVSPEEIQFRLRREELDDLHRRRVEMTKFVVQEAAVYVVGLFLIVVLSSSSAVILSNKSSPPETQAWARSTLTAIATAVAGYVFGKSSS